MADPDIVNGHEAGLAEFVMPTPLHFHWLVDDLHICAGPPASGQLWCLDVDVRRLSTDQCERMLWDANTPWGLVRRDPHSSTIMSVSSGQRERDLLIIAEQGIGDIIQQLRYVAPVAAHFSRTRIQCKPELHRLIRRQAMQAEPVVPAQVEADPPKVRVPLMRMGALCADPRQGAAYLSTPGRPRTWHEGLRIGLNWSASVKGVAKDIKSIPVLLLEPLIRAHPDVSWVSVQWGDDEARLMKQPWAAQIEACGRTVSDVADLADVISGLDLLITIDSAPAHLAGALGIPVWTLLTRPCSWRWGLGSSQTDLYRSMRLFRQTDLHAWPELLSRVSSALESAKSSADTLVAAGQLDACAHKNRPGTVIPMADDASPTTLSAVLNLCKDAPRLRAAFVAHPLKFLAMQGVHVQSRDYRKLNQMFQAMVDFHGGFSWCWPLKPLQSSTFNTTVAS